MYNLYDQLKIFSVTVDNKSNILGCDSWIRQADCIRIHF